MSSKTKPYQRDAVMSLLRDHPTWSNKDIAAQVPGVHPNAVAQLRNGIRPPTRPRKAPETTIDPNPQPSISLDNVADLDEPPPPPPGMEYQPLPELDIRPHLHSGTSKLIDQIVPNLAEIATAVALRVAPEHVQPLIPSPQTAEVLIAAPCRIVARHSHIRVDEMSEDAKDVSAMLMAIGAWAVEIRANFTARAEWYAQNGAPSNGQRPNAAGRAAPSAGVSDAGSYAASAQPAGGAWAGFAGAGAMAAEVPSSNGHARGGGGSVEPDPSTGKQLMAHLYSADAIGRRQRGLQ